MSFSFSKAFLFPMRRKLVTGALIVLVFAAPILFAHAGGFFATSQNEKARRGKIVVEEIKGTMTMEDIARGMGLDSETLRQVLGVEGNVPESTKLYDLEDLQASLTLKTVKQKLSDYLVEVN